MIGANTTQRGPGADDGALYYVQDKCSRVGNSMLWWKEDSRAYVCDIRQAKIWTRAEIEQLWTEGGGGDKYVAWPKVYIDERVKHHVDCQLCNRQEAGAIT